MIKHIVMWQLKEEAEGADKATNAKKMKALLDACADIVPGEVHRNPRLGMGFVPQGHNVFRDLSVRQETAWSLGRHLVEAGGEMRRFATELRFTILGDRNPVAVNGSSVQGGAEMGCYSTALPGGLPLTPANAEALERLGKVNIVILDKTGTLTAGTPAVASIVG